MSIHDIIKVEQVFKANSEISDQKAYDVFLDNIYKHISDAHVISIIFREHRPEIYQQFLAKAIPVY